MIIILSLIPVLALISSVLVYKQNGKKEILRFDMVQFFYAFILMPTVFIWFKGFIYFLLKSELGQVISQRELFLFDTAYSVFFLFLFAFVVIHSLTKSFELKRNKDPLYDLFEHSEYYHLWVSHTIFFTGTMFLLTMLSGLNIWMDFSLTVSNSFFYGILLTTPLTALAVFKVFMIADFGDFRFLKLMKLFIGVFFLTHGILYIIFEPAFSSEKIMYWYSSNSFGFLALISLIHTSEPGPIPVHKRIGRKALWFVRKIKSRTK